MTFVTPVDGQPALASHVSQITDTLVGTRSEPVTLLSTLTVGGVTFASLVTRIAALEAQVVTLQSQMAGHTHTSGTIDAMGGTAVMP